MRVPTVLPTQDELRVAAWAEVRDLLELQLAPLGSRALAVLAPRAGETILDIGCGGGETVLAAALGEFTGLVPDSSARTAAHGDVLR